MDLNAPPLLNGLKKSKIKVRLQKNGEPINLSLINTPTAYALSVFDLTSPVFCLFPKKIKIKVNNPVSSG
jgi:hypothetical protein